MSEIASPLDGLVVLDLTVDRPGSVAGMLLADLGADVIRIETTDGDHRRSDPYVEPDWICWDRGKRTVTVGALDPLIDRTFGELLGTADIVLLDPIPGAAYGAPLDPQALSAAHPRLAVDLGAAVRRGYQPPTPRRWSRTREQSAAQVRTLFTRSPSEGGRRAQTIRRSLAQAVS